MAKWHGNIDDIKPFIKNKKTLDVGAGHGELLKFAGEGSKGIDLHPEADNVYEGDACTFKLDEKFEVVVLSSIIEHLPSKAAVLMAFKNAHAHLQDGGLIIVQCPHAFDTGAWYDFEHELVFTHHAVMQGLEMAGFKVIRGWTRLRLPFDQFFVRNFGLITLPISSDYVMKLLASVNAVRDVIVIGMRNF